MSTVAAVLAAGGGTRFGGPTHKLLADLDGRPVWRHAVESAVAAGFPKVVVVTGAADLHLPAGVEDWPNPRWADGQATSLQVAVAAARHHGATHLVVGLADQPFVPPTAWAAVRGADPACRIVVATYDGRPGPNPVRLAADVWPLLPEGGDLGARDVIRAHPAWVCPVACLGSVADIDTPEDLARWKSC